MTSNNILLWENSTFSIKTPFNPHIPYAEGLHIMVAPKASYESAWSDPSVAARTFELSAQACKILEDIDMAPWFNIQANGNWGLLPGARRFFHVHIYGRNETANWGKPVAVPEAPETYNNEPMPETDRNIIIEAFKQLS